MNDISDRSVATLTALDKVSSINLDVLLSRAAELQGTLRKIGELEPGDSRHLTMHLAPHSGDVVGVAAEVQRLGFAIERVQQR